LRRGIVVHNYYRPEAAISEDLIPRWTPGDMEQMRDEAEDARAWQLKIASNLATVIDWAMSEYDVDRNTAEQMVKDNAELNKTLSVAGTQGFSGGSASGGME
jgi:hypothetical protein